MAKHISFAQTKEFNRIMGNIKVKAFKEVDMVLQSASERAREALTKNFNFHWKLTALVIRDLLLGSDMSNICICLLITVPDS